MNYGMFWSKYGHRRPVLRYMPYDSNLTDYPIIFRIPNLTISLTISLAVTLILTTTLSVYVLLADVGM